MEDSNNISGKNPLPVIPVVGRPMFPKTNAPIAIDNAELLAFLMRYYKGSKKTPSPVLVVYRISDGSSSRTPSIDDLAKFGVYAEIHHIEPIDDDVIHLSVTTEARARISSFTPSEGGVIWGEYERIEEPEPSEDKKAILRAYSVATIQAIEELMRFAPPRKEELYGLINQSSLSDPGRLSDLATSLSTAPGNEQQRILEAVDILERIKLTLMLLRREIVVSQLKMGVTRTVEAKLGKQQREYFLREQLKVIRQELGEGNGAESEEERIRKRMEGLALSEEAKARIAEELEKLGYLDPHMPEFGVTRSYLDWLTQLPWGITTEDRLDLAKAKEILDEDHYGLKDVKERILEFLATGILKGGISGTILCLVGPPGTGKTSLGRSIARAIGRKFYRFSVGGMRDEAEIKGHRRTYIGAMPGKLIQLLKTCASSNPVVMIDEIDKLNSGIHGDPASALLEALDPEQNTDFLDHYLDVRFSLNKVFFICTANQLDTIPVPLLDRMEVIRLSGYIMPEKVEIAKRYLIPKCRTANGIKAEQVTLSDAALRRVIDGYAREAGVRSLEKNISKIMRKSARRLLEKSEPGKLTIKSEEIEELLGPPEFTDDKRSNKPLVGVVTGLAWTQFGGDTLAIEAIALPAERPELKQTGQLGDVMIESTQIAYSYVRSLLAADNDARKRMEKSLVHIHVPAGAIKKDGPSAGITLATAIYSLMKNTPVKRKIAMTGELTLTGRVMPIGGLKEKVIAARRAGITTLIFPEENRKDYALLPEEIVGGLEIHFVRDYKQVLEICF